MTELDLAYNRIDRDLNRIEARVEQRVAKALRGLRRQVVAQPLAPHSIKLPKDAIAALRDGMLEADDLGIRRSELEFKRAQLSLATGPRLTGGNVASARIWEFTAQTALQKETVRVRRAIQSVINRGLKAGNPPERIAKDVKKKFDALGLSPRNPSAVATVVRTHTAMAYAAGQWRGDSRPEVQRRLWGYIYVTRGDDRVRPHHRELDGVTLPKTDPFWRSFFPPNDYNCRCKAIAIYAEPTGGIVHAPPHVRPTRGFSFNPGMVFRL